MAGGKRGSVEGRGGGPADSRYRGQGDHALRKVRAQIVKRWVLTLVCAGYLAAQNASVEQAWSLLREGRRPEAVALLRGLIRENPANADARLLLGSVLMEQGQREESIAQLTEAVRLRPRSAEAQNALGEAYNAFEDPKSARAPFERAIAIDPRFAIARVNLGAVLIQTGEL